MEKYSMKPPYDCHIESIVNYEIMPEVEKIVDKQICRELLGKFHEVNHGVGGIQTWFQLKNEIKEAKINDYIKVLHKYGIPIFLSKFLVSLRYGKTSKARRILVRVNHPWWKRNNQNRSLLLRFNKNMTTETGPR